MSNYQCCSNRKSNPSSQNSLPLTYETCNTSCLEVLLAVLHSKFFLVYLAGFDYFSYHLFKFAYCCFIELCLSCVRIQIKPRQLRTGKVPIAKIPNASPFLSQFILAQAALNVTKTFLRNSSPVLRLS